MWVRVPPSRAWSDSLPAQGEHTRNYADLSWEQGTIRGLAQDHTGANRERAWRNRAYKSIEEKSRVRKNDNP
jgi:hypothetical protein